MNPALFGQPVTLEQHAIQAANNSDFDVFERRVTQLKALYKNDPSLVPTEQTYMVMGLYLLYLLGSDRIADFHTELESISTHEQNNQYIRYPIQLERYIMEGNYAKVLIEKRERAFDGLFNKLQDAIKTKQHETRLESSLSNKAAPSPGVTLEAALSFSILNNMIEISEARRRLSRLGVEWDLKWDLTRLRKELGEKTRAIDSITFPPPSTSVKYFITHISIERLVCFQKSLLIGHFKVRLTVSSARGLRPPITYESPLPFQSGRVLSTEGIFRVPLILNIHRDTNPLNEWRFEFEILHKFPSGPIYSVVSRAWLSAELLVSAQAIDLFPCPGEDASVKLEFGTIRTSKVAVNLFRTVSRAVLFACKLQRALANSKLKETERLEKQMKYINERNSNERQAAQQALLARSLDVMNRYMQTGSRPDDWVKSLISAGIIPINNDISIRQLESRISELSKQLEGLKNDVIKTLVDNSKSQPVQYIQSTAASLSPTAAANAPSFIESITTAFGGLTTAGNPPQIPPPIIEVKEPPPKVVAAPVTPIEDEVKADLPSPPEKPETAAVDPPIEDYTSTINNAVTSLWGAINSAVGAGIGSGATTPKAEPPSEKRKSVDTSPLIRAISGKTTPVKPPTEGLVKTTPVNLPPKKSVAVKKSVVVSPPKKPADPKSILSAKQAAVKAKVATYLKVKALEAKRKAEVEKREMEIKALSCKLPPPDRSKFIGLPGPPPFAPKAASVAKAALPSLMDQGEAVEVPEDPEDNDQ